MAQLVCYRCHRVIKPPAPTGAARQLCTLCRKVVDLSQAAASCWLVQTPEDETGPDSWKQLLSQAARGQLSSLDLQERAGLWVRASAAALVEEPRQEERELVAAVQAAASATTVPVAAPVQATAPAPLAVPPAPDFQVEVPTPLACPPRVEPADDVSLGTVTIVEAPDPVVMPWRRPSRLKKTGTLLGAAVWLGMCALLVALISRGGPPPEAIPSEHVAKLGESETKLPTVPPEQESVSANAAVTPRVIDFLNLQRKLAGLPACTLDAELSQACQAHARYLAAHVALAEASPLTVYTEDALKQGYTDAGHKTARAALVAYTEPAHAAQRWLGRLFSRVQLLHPDLQRVGIGFAQDAQGTWITVVDAVQGRDPLASRGREVRPVVYPTPNQDDVPCTGFDVIPEAAGSSAGYPINLTFPRQTSVRNLRATLTDEHGNLVAVRVSSPEQPLNVNLQGATVALHSLSPLQAGCRYMVDIAATVNGVSWHYAWPFTTSR